MKKLFYFAVIIGLFASCELYEQDEYQEQYVVESYLYANRTLPFVRISTTVPAYDYYDYSHTSNVKNAQVQVALMETENDEIAESIIEYEFKKNNYYPVETHLVKPGRTYRLKITIPEYENSITGFTTVPGDFEILSYSQDTLIYKSDEILEMNVSKSHYPNRQSIFIFNTLADSGTEENITPLFNQIWTEKEFDPHYFRRLSTHSWGTVNETNFKLNENGTVFIEYPWSEFPFFGGNMIVVNTIDNNLFDFLRSQSVQRSETGIPPGEMPNVINNIEGALGIFASVASDSINVYLKRPE